MQCVSHLQFVFFLHQVLIQIEWLVVLFSCYEKLYAGVAAKRKTTHGKPRRDRLLIGRLGRPGGTKTFRQEQFEYFDVKN